MDAFIDKIDAAIKETFGSIGEFFSKIGAEFRAFFEFWAEKLNPSGKKWD